ncbi:unnamed protein product [Spirodela intermedia]|uniref:Peptidase A1 domain-containing protein n=1 Tax=Spirodela intermedia TaxID=51605 RepID=A0A7I8L455_SPIIN|nr:unnamed protein product [Spirodela intermedia]
MAASAPFFLFLFLSATASAAATSSSSPQTAAIHLPLRHINAVSSDGGGLSGAQRLAGLVSASLFRARHMKDPEKIVGTDAGAPSAVPVSRNPLFSHSYGGYTISLGFGTPPQRIPLVVDTGSDLVWVPCTRSYVCNNCSFPRPGVGVAPPPLVFSPKSSSSAKLVGCRNPKCSWIHSPDLITRCRDCPVNGSASACSPVCPPYMVVYGSGSTGGLLLSEKLELSPAAAGPIADFAVGCSLFSARQPPAGVVGFGRGPASLPSQLGLPRFSYCLVSRRFDDASGESGSIILGGASFSSSSSSGGISFTPFLKNPSAGSPFSIYYYLALHRITVDGRKVKIPRAALAPRAGGDGGTVIDSGTTFTYMEPDVFAPLERAVEARVAGRYNRSAAAETTTGLRPCFSPASPSEKLQLPQLSFHFKGGAEMRLPLANYFAFAGGSGAVCLTIITDAGGAGGAADGGPSVILGSFQQQNYHVVYDLERERLGFRRQSCLEKQS